MENTHLTYEERIQISVLLKDGYSKRAIAIHIGRSHSTIVREITRNSASGKYDPNRAKQKARSRRKLSKYQGMKVQQRPELQKYIIFKLKQNWTPEQIAGRLKNIDTHLPYISAKGIYKWIYSVWGAQYHIYLPKQRSSPKKRKKKKTKREMIPDRVSIHERPLEANLRSETGHFEEDTLVSGRKIKSKAAIAVLCDRQSLYVRISKIKNTRPSTHIKAQKQMAKGLNIKTITYDNGIENKHHLKLAKQLKVKTYFCDPYSSWQKGTVENTIGRIRRFIPKGSNLSLVHQSQIHKIQYWLNHTPRKCLNYYTPYEIMYKNLPNIFNPTGAVEG